MEITSGLCYKNRVRITSESCVRLALGSYIMKSCKLDQKIRYQLRFEVTSGLCYKNHVRIA